MTLYRETTLNEIRPGNSGIVLGIETTPKVKRRLTELGITPGVEIWVKKSAPFGDPVQLHLRGYELSLRREEAKSIRVRQVTG